jgi:hypothetical protein
MAVPMGILIRLRTERIKTSIRAQLACLRSPTPPMIPGTEKINQIDNKQGKLC